MVASEVNNTERTFTCWSFPHLLAKLGGGGGGGGGGCSHQTELTRRPHKEPHPV